MSKMKKWATIAVASLLATAIAVPGQLQAATRPITVYIDGVLLTTPQAPVMIAGRTMLPMRSIFQALGAEIRWNQSTKTVTAVSNGTTIVLPIGSRTATVNGNKVTLDVPAKIINNTTMVPVRFTSESLGGSIGWNKASQTVTIKSPAPPAPPVQPVAPVANVSARTVNQFGDGRDLEVNFTRSSDDQRVGHYRVYVVKTGSSGAFNQSLALALPLNRYTVVNSGTSNAVTLGVSAQDTDGEFLRAGQPYRVYILAVGSGGQAALSSASSEVTLTSVPSVNAVSNVQARDTGNYGDGRDLSVSFSRAAEEQQIGSYRIMTVKTANASSFNLQAANAVPSAYYTTVNKSGAALNAVLSSGSRDTSGDLIRNGVPYTVFVLSVSSSGTFQNKLSASAVITLSGQITSPVITQVKDVSNYGNGRDLQLSFSKVSDETPIYNYRIFAVKNAKAADFDLTQALRVTSANYYEASKTGADQTRTLPADMRDTDGAYVRNNESYRLFVMSVPSNTSLNSSGLSAPSAVVTLTNDNVEGATGLIVGDVSDYNNGQDLMVAFNRSSNETRLSQYRIMVVKASKASSFTLAQAENVSSSNYTATAKTGSNISRVLGSGARDTDGALIQNGIAYRVFILSVAADNSGNALSTPSDSITLSTNYTVGPATDVTAADNGDGASLTVSFSKPSSTANVSQYRVLLVKTGNAGSFGLTQANAAGTGNYTLVNATSGSGSLTAQLVLGTKDVNGETMKQGVSYRVFVLSVAANGGSNALSAASSPVVLTNRAVEAATVVSASWKDSEIEVNVTRPANTTGIAYYTVLAVPAGEAPLTLEQASNRSGVRLTSGNSVQLGTSAGVTEGQGYRIYVLSVADGSSATVNALSPAFTVAAPAVSPDSVPAE